MESWISIKAKATYHGNGDKDYKIPHIKFEDKIIFVLGYDNRDKWELVLDLNLDVFI